MFGLIGEVLELFSLPYFILMAIATGLFVWWMYRRFKKDIVENKENK